MSKLEYTARELMVSGTNNACISGFAFNPLNLVRARLQVQDQLAPGTYRSLWHSLTTIAKEDGALALWRYGVAMSSFREASYGGMQWGLYTPLKTLWNQTGLPPMVANVATGLSAGIVASAFITPIDLVMIRPPPRPPPPQPPLLSCSFTDAARRAIRGGRASGCAHGAVHTTGEEVLRLLHYFRRLGDRVLGGCGSSLAARGAHGCARVRGSTRRFHLGHHHVALRVV